MGIRSYILKNNQTQLIPLYVKFKKMRVIDVCWSGVCVVIYCFGLFCVQDYASVETDRDRNRGRRHSSPDNSISGSLAALEDDHFDGTNMVGSQHTFLQVPPTSRPPLALRVIRFQIVIRAYTSSKEA